MKRAHLTPNSTIMLCLVLGPEFPLVFLCVLAVRSPFSISLVAALALLTISKGTSDWISPFFLQPLSKTLTFNKLTI